VNHFTTYFSILNVNNLFYDNISILYDHTKILFTFFFHLLEEVLMAVQTDGGINGLLRQSSQLVVFIVAF